MKIGQVSKKYGISKDNLYYYIKYGLLVPKKKGANYDFDAQTLEDLERILQLKKMRFSLSQIHRILSLYRISSLADPKDVEDLKHMCRDQLSYLNSQRLDLDRQIGNLENLIDSISRLSEPVAGASGVPLSMLSLICCPECGSDFELSDIKMNQHYIHRAHLKCSCGYEASIEDGILITPNRNTDMYDTPDVNRDMYKNLPPSLISLFEKSYNWMGEKIGKMDLNNKVVIETYVNAWCFMHNHQKLFSPSGKYIIVDKYPETLRMYKELIDMQNYNLDILYIADSSTNFPLKEGCVDLCIDYFAVNEHNFYHESFLYDKLDKYFNSDTRLLGTYFYFDKGIRSMKNLIREYPTASKNNFSISYFTDNMAGAVEAFEDCGYTESSGDNIGFSFHQDGEKMYLRAYIAKASKRKKQT